MKMKAWVAVFTVFMLLAVCQVVAGEESTIVKVSPADQTVSTGESFAVEIVVEPATAIAGVQFDMSFDPSLLTVTSVVEGNFFSQGGADTYFNSGTIDNSAGSITGVAGVILGPNSVSSSGTFAIIHVIAENTEGISSLTLENVIVGDPDAVAVSSTVQSGSVTISAQALPSEGGILTTVSAIILAAGVIIAVLVVLIKLGH